MGTSSGWLAAEALQHAREQIGEIGEQQAWERWQDDRVVWRLAEGPDGSPQSLFLAGHMLMTAEQDRPSPAALLAAQYVVGAVVLVLTWHGWRPSSPWWVAAPGWPPSGEGNGGGNRSGGNPGVGDRDNPLAGALAALDQACDRARSRPAVLRGVAPVAARPRAGPCRAGPGGAGGGQARPPRQPDRVRAEWSPEEPAASA